MSYINATHYFESIDCQIYPKKSIFKVDNVPVEKNVCVGFMTEGIVGGYEIKENNGTLEIMLFEHAAITCKNPLTKWQTLNDTNCFNINFHGRNESFKIELYDRQFKSNASVMRIGILFILIITLKYIF